MNEKNIRKTLDKGKILVLDYGYKSVTLYKLINREPYAFSSEGEWVKLTHTNLENFIKDTLVGEDVFEY